MLRKELPTRKKEDILGIIKHLQEKLL